MRSFHIRLAIGTALLAGLVGCSAPSEPPPVAPSPTPTTETPPPATATPVEPPPVAPVAPAVVDRFEQYAAVVSPLDPNVNKAELRKKYNQAAQMFCPGGLEQMQSLKSVASTSLGRTEAEQLDANKRAALSIGALWEFGCGKGRDEELYTPVPVKAAAGASAKWPCEPGYPNCTKAESDRYVAQLEYKNSTGVKDANGETKEEYCKRTGQPLATCQAG